MDKTAENHRFNNAKSFLQCDIQGGGGRHHKTDRKKGGIKVHSVIHANEGVSCDVQFTSTATNDSFMLAPNYYQHEEIITMNMAYINYRKFEELTDKGVWMLT